MKTIFIYSNAGSYEVISPEFFVLDGDYQHLNDVYINGCSSDPDWHKQKELANLIYDEEGNYKIESLKKFPVDCILNQQLDCAIITCGFIH